MRTIIILLFLSSCGTKGDAPPPIPTEEMMTQENYFHLAMVRDVLQAESELCDGNVPCLRDEDEGDALLWTGLLAFSRKGLIGQPPPISPSEFQSGDGRLWRSPSRARDELDVESKNSFSRDMFVGWLLLQTSFPTPIIDTVKEFVEYVRDNNYIMCPENVRSACSLHYLQHRTAWAMIGNLYLANELNQPIESFQARAGDETQLAAEATAAIPGSDAHLVGAMALLYKHYEPSNGIYELVAEKLYNADNGNTFFKWMHKGNTLEVYNEVVDRCVTNDIHTDYAWRRASREKAWEKDAGHGCVVLINLILKGRQ